MSSRHPPTTTEMPPARPPAPLSASLRTLLTSSSGLVPWAILPGATSDPAEATRQHEALLRALTEVTVSGVLQGTQHLPPRFTAGHPEPGLAAEHDREPGAPGANDPMRRENPVPPATAAAGAEMADNAHDPIRRESAPPALVASRAASPIGTEDPKCRENLANPTLPVAVARMVGSGPAMTKAAMPVPSEENPMRRESAPPACKPVVDADLRRHDGSGRDPAGPEHKYPMRRETPKAAPPTAEPDNRTQGAASMRPPRSHPCPSASIRGSKPGLLVAAEPAGAKHPLQRENHVPPPPTPRTGPLRNGNPRGNPNLAPRCGARTRLGCPCRGPAMTNGRCRMHGGASTGPRTPEGRARISAAHISRHHSSPERAAFRRNTRAFIRNSYDILRMLRRPDARHMSADDLVRFLPAIPVHPALVPHPSGAPPIGNVNERPHAKRTPRSAAEPAVLTVRLSGTTSEPRQTSPTEWERTPRSGG